MSERTWLLMNTRRGHPPLCWLQVTGVPVTVKRAEVLERLGAWKYGARYAPALGDHLTLRLRRGMADAARVEFSKVDRVSWAQLAPASRRVTLSVPDSLHRRLSEHARRSGNTLTDVIVAALEAVAP